MYVAFTLFAGKDHFINLKASYLATGLTTRVHGNANRQPKHALKLDEVKTLVTFLNNYAEKNAILLPGRIPGFINGMISSCYHRAPLRRYPPELVMLSTLAY